MTSLNPESHSRSRPFPPFSFSKTCSAQDPFPLNQMNASGGAEPCTDVCTPVAPGTEAQRGNGKGAFSSDSSAIVVWPGAGPSRMTFSQETRNHQELADIFFTGPERKTSFRGLCFCHCIFLTLPQQQGSSQRQYNEGVWVLINFCLQK